MEQQEINKNVVQGLNQLFVWFASLKPNAYTKKPSINLKQEEAIEVLKHVNEIAALLGYQNRIQTNDDESVSVILEEIPLPETVQEAVEELNSIQVEKGVQNAE